LIEANATKVQGRKSCAYCDTWIFLGVRRGMVKENFRLVENVLGCTITFTVITKEVYADIIYTMLLK